MTNDKATEWHREVISDATEAALRSLRDAKVLDRFYLAGGTGLALRFGHRMSRDFDFFVPSLFDENSLLAEVDRLVGFSLVAKEPHTLHAVVQETKVSFLGYPYPMLFPSAQFLQVAIADSRDIACMKISAIASRGMKRDFVDLYASAQQFGLGALLQLFERKYAQSKYNRLHILKSLTFFEDAEKDPMPHMLIPMDWEQVKEFFVRQTSRLL